MEQKAPGMSPTRSATNAKIVPTISVANNPFAMPENPSMKMCDNMPPVFFFKLNTSLPVFLFHRETLFRFLQVTTDKRIIMNIQQKRTQFSVTQAQLIKSPLLFALQIK